MTDIDLNSDLGEGFARWELGDDEALLSVVTSANVACGYHAGDASTMRRTASTALARGVAVGAQVGYHDLAGFGRRFIDVEPATLADEVLHQVAALDGMARVAGGRVTYVKPHGALYHAVVHHEAQATAVVEAVHDYDPSLAVLGLPGSLLLRLAEKRGLRPVPEAFADRAYTSDGTLVPRDQPGAVLHDPVAIAARCVALASGEAVLDVAGGALRLRAESICVHGDTPGAVTIARSVREALAAAGVRLRPFSVARPEDSGW
jgi:5-oxoprolinase (ATP-hydrolysing) subunit A